MPPPPPAPILITDYPRIPISCRVYIIDGRLTIELVTSTNPSATVDHHFGEQTLRVWVVAGAAPGAAPGAVPGAAGNNNRPRRLATGFVEPFVRVDGNGGGGGGGGGYELSQSLYLCGCRRGRLCCWVEWRERQFREELARLRE